MSGEVEKGFSGHKTGKKSHPAVSCCFFRRRRPVDFRDTVRLLHCLFRIASADLVRLARG
jgi:hypothetical protein